MSNTKNFGIKISGWGDAIYYTITTPASTTRDAVRAALTADKPINHYRPNDWTPQMAYRCDIHGWRYGCGIDGEPDIQLGSKTSIV